jgi:hypothetical protein
VAWATARAAPDRVATLTVLSTPHLDAMRDAYLDPNGEQSRMSGYMQTFRTPGVENGILANGADSFVRVFAAGGGLPEREARRYDEVLFTPAALGAALNGYSANPLPAPTSLGPITVPTCSCGAGAQRSAHRRATGRYVTAPTASRCSGAAATGCRRAAADVVPSCSPTSPTPTIAETAPCHRRHGTDRRPPAGSETFTQSSRPLIDSWGTTATISVEFAGRAAGLADGDDHRAWRDRARSRRTAPGRGSSRSTGGTRRHLGVEPVEAAAGP